MTVRDSAASLFDAFAATVRKQRLTWSCCIVVSLLLVYRFNTPLVPVLLGCLMALVFTGWRSHSSASGVHRG